MNNLASKILIVVCLIGGIWLFSGNSHSAKETGSTTEAIATSTIVSSQTDSESALPAFGKIVTAQAKELIKNNSISQIIDIRTKDEFDAGHIEGATNIDFYQSDFAQKIGQLDKTEVYLIYCRSGGRSSQAVIKFQELGFQKIYELEGGYLTWT